jgi:hypothetical protein
MRMLFGFWFFYYKLLSSAVSAVIPTARWGHVTDRVGELVVSVLSPVVSRRGRLGMQGPATGRMGPLPTLHQDLAGVVVAAPHRTLLESARLKGHATSGIAHAGKAAPIGPVGPGREGGLHGRKGRGRGKGVALAVAEAGRGTPVLRVSTVVIAVVGLGADAIDHPTQQAVAAHTMGPTFPGTAGPACGPTCVGSKRS